MNGHLSRPTKLQTLQSLVGLTASLLAVAWTLDRWGVTEALCGVTPVLLLLACLGALLAAVAVIAWVTRTWGAGNALRGVAPWLAVAACVSVTLAGLAVLAATLQANGWAGPVCTMTCLVWLGDFATRRLGGVCRRVREMRRRRAGTRGPLPRASAREADEAGTGCAGPAVPRGRRGLCRALTSGHPSLFQ